MLNLNSKGFIFDEKSGGKDPIVELSWLLSAEVTSLNSFVHCLETPTASSLHAISVSCRDLHAINVRLLSERLAELGADVPPCTDLWHSFLELVSAAASVFGEEAILAAFRKHEINLLSEYETKIGFFGCEDLVLVQGTLIPNQMKVCELLGAIRSDNDACEMMTNKDMLSNLNLA